jgi:hypothetical protein
MPGHMAAQKRQDIRDAITSGMKIEDIRQLLSTSTGTIVKIKREMGIAIRPMRQTRTRGPVRTVAQPPEGDPPSSQTYAEAHIESLYAEQPAPITPFSPEDYVAAFEDRVLEYRSILAQKDSAIERLERELAKLRDECAQIVHRQQNWQGPTSTITQSLGNGG